MKASFTCFVLSSLVALASSACGEPGKTAGAGASGGANTVPGGGGSAAGTGGAGGSGQATGGSGGAGGPGGAGGTAGSAVQGGSAGSDGAAGAPGTGGMSGAGGSVNNLPVDYQGTPFTTLTIPGRINAADYDRGGAGVAWCHTPGNCTADTVTGDWYPPGSDPYRQPMPADAQICGGAACDDNVGVCRMNPGKPDNTIDGDPMPPEDTYLCYTTAGTWTKYTVVVMEAGAYAVSGVMGVQQEASANISFGADITTGDMTFPVTPTANSGSGEGFHSWDDRANLATVTFSAPGTYLMTLTQVSRFNADSFSFTRM
jgi:hypothetical protein